MSNLLRKLNVTNMYWKRRCRTGHISLYSLHIFLVQCFCEFGGFCFARACVHEHHLCHEFVDHFPWLFWQGIVYSLLDKEKEALEQFEIYQSLVPEEFPQKKFLDDVILSARTESKQQLEKELQSWIIMADMAFATLSFILTTYQLLESQPAVANQFYNIIVHEHNLQGVYLDVSAMILNGWIQLWGAIFCESYNFLW